MEASPYKRTLGIIMIVASSLLLIMTICVNEPFVGDPPVPPCGTGEPEIDKSSRTLLAYCINLWPWNSSYETNYAMGTTGEDEMKAGTFTLKRQGQILFVDYHLLQPGQTYRTVRWTFQPDLWLIIMTRYEIHNDGIKMVTASLTPGDVLFASGDAYESGIPNPIGLCFFCCGIWLIVLGNRERKKIHPPSEADVKIDLNPR